MIERKDGQLLTNIQLRMEPLKKLLESMDSHCGGEDGIYRYYHQSFKVFHLQDYTKQVVEEMKLVDPRSEDEWHSYHKLDPEKDRAVRQVHQFEPMFESIIAAGTGKDFSRRDTNSNWEAETLPITTAYFHAHYILTMMVKYGEKLDEAPQLLPFGWASVLYMYAMR